MIFYMLTLYFFAFHVAFFHFLYFYFDYYYFLWHLKNILFQILGFLMLIAYTLYFLLCF